jgi:hypothetical protein
VPDECSTNDVSDHGVVRITFGSDDDLAGHDRRW